MRTIECTLPSGKTVVLRELTGTEELAAAQAVSSIESVAGQMILSWNQILRSLAKIDGKDFDPSKHTAQSARDLFTAVDWQLVCDAFGMLNRPTLAEAESFRAAVRIGSMEAAGAAQGDDPASS